MTGLSLRLLLRKGLCEGLHSVLKGRSLLFEVLQSDLQVFRGELAVLVSESELLLEFGVLVLELLKLCLILSELEGVLILESLELTL